MSGHTDGTWTVDPHLHRSNGAIWGPDGMTVCHVTDRGGETRDNAEFIVRACNSHEALLEACRLALPVLLSHADANSVAAFVDRAIQLAESK